MRRNLEVFGLALFVTLAAVAAAAPAAHATQASFTATKYSATLNGEQEGGAVSNYFEYTAGRRWSCEQGSYEGTLLETTEAVTVTPHYTKCEFGGVSTTTHLNGCHYVFEVGTKVSAEHAQGSFSIVCPVGKKIETTWGTCKIHIGAQTIASALTFKNVSAGDVTVEVDTTSKLHYEDTDAFLCPFEGNSTGENGSLVSSIRLEAFVAPVDIDVG